MNDRNILSVISLQMFAEGTGGAAAAGDGGTAQGAGVTAPVAAGQNKGAKNPLADVRYGIQQDAPAAVVQQTTEPQSQTDPAAEFEELIRGRFKDQYNARVQDTVQKRLKGTKETVEKYEALAPMLEMLGKKYGVDATDAAALAKAIQEDDSFYEEEADRMGLSVEQLKQIRSMERENAELKKQMQQRSQEDSANKLYAQWMEQAESAKQVYPGLDLRAEMQNPKFVDLLRSNIDVKTAYEVIHKDEIIPAAMHFAAQAIESKVAKSIAANGARPTENGTGAQSAAVVKSDVSQLTRADRDEIRRRVARGEKIRF